ncbi:MAG: AAA family ATPase [Bacteroidota bacterium]
MISTLLIFGAAGSGTTTLAHSLAERLQWTHLDADAYYWEATPIPFQQKVPKAIRQQRLIADVEQHTPVVVSGSLATWGEYWQTAFDLAVFLQLPSELRMVRLRQREIARYGDSLKTHPERQAISDAFLTWAAQYDDPNFEGRSIRQHQDWMKQLSCEVLNLKGDLSNEERIRRVLAHPSFPPPTDTPRPEH